MVLNAGAAGGAAAAAAAALRKRREEEEMTPYTASDLAEFEFKIIRSHTGQFKTPEKFRAVLAEEAQAGWELVEKFDDDRARLKRQLAWRAKDAELGWDPYRTTIGMSETKLVLYILGAIFGTLAVIGLGAAIISNFK